MKDLGSTVAYLRQRLGLSQRAAADELGISYVYLNRLETGKVSPTSSMLDKFFEKWGIDIYMLAVCRNEDVSRLPKPMQLTAGKLKRAWEQEINSIIEKRNGRPGNVESTTD